MTPTPTPIAAVPVLSVREALIVIKEAREMCLNASYHPAGGDSCRGYTPVTHTVWVEGKNLDEFLKMLEQK
jgi:hypothetical protein